MSRNGRCKKCCVCVCVYVHVSVLILAVGFKYITNKNTVFLCRGDTFRREFAHLREVNSLIPEGVHTMALTATATRYSRQKICLTLGMRKPVLIVQPPSRPNIYYVVYEKTTDLEGTVSHLLNELRQKRTEMEHTIIFFQRYDDCTRCYLYFRSELGPELSHPVGFPNIASLRLCDMFTACVRSEVKDIILKLYRNPTSCLRIIFATIAFGMGLDCPNVRHVIHWGVPSDIESYLQETGRAGRDDQPSRATLYFTGKDFSGLRVEESMKQYCLLKDGCRTFLLKEGL